MSRPSAVISRHQPEIATRETKRIMDPDNIFNPHKKADADWEYSFGHIRDHF